MSAKAPGGGSRVIVAVGPAAPDSPALAAAAQLAQSAGAELAALFVEDINLLRLAELPFALEIGTASATMRPFAAPDVERALKRQAGELRRTLAEMAHAAQLDWTFGMVRGRPVSVLLEAAGEGDLVVLASSMVRTFAHAGLASAMRSALSATLPGKKPRRARPVAAALQPGPNALRVLAVAYRPLEEIPASVTPETVEKDLIFIGLLGMIDPPRPEVIEALKVARAAGLKSIMVTGDYKDTAEAIARDIGLRTPGGLVLAGPEIETLSDEELADRVDQLDVCCRVSPQHKTRIVDALKSRGHVVAMTGDGVNDAPALKRANIGVAMGVTGTDVAKQTADMVLTDDNFASIVAAIEQGRIIYSNIRKFVYFLLACNIGEILIIFGAMLVGFPIPLRPVQLLWLNLVSDGAPALALGLEKGDPDIMKRSPRSPREPVIDRDMAIGIGVVGLVDAVAILTLFSLALQRYPGHLEAATTIAFVALCTSELIRAFTARSEYHSVFSIGVFSNRWMVWAVGASFLLVLMVVYVPFFRPFFDTVPLSANDWLLMAPFFFASPFAMELLKVYFRKRAKSQARTGQPPSAVHAAEVPQPPSGQGSLSRPLAAEKTVLKLLLPVDGSRNSEAAVQQVIKDFMNNTAMEVHLLNVQPPFTRHIARFSSRRGRNAYHRDRAEIALAPIRQMLDNFGIPYSAHIEVGNRAECIAEAARRLRCHQIVMGTARKNSLTRLIEDSVTTKVIELTPVPVEIIAGDAVSKFERYGIPVGLAVALAALLAAAD